jgi:GH43 family beta-xylosidase
MDRAIVPSLCLVLASACGDSTGVASDTGTSGTGGTTSGAAEPTSTSQSTGGATSSTGSEPTPTTGAPSDCEDSFEPGCGCGRGEVEIDGECVHETCAADTCHGHGLCSVTLIGVQCTCDEGFTGERCDTPGPDAYARTLLMPGLADPDIYKEHDDLFFLTGTGDTVSVPIFATHDLLNFTEKRIYSPAALDPNHDYCYVWAPDLTKRDGVYHLYFSAHRVAKGAACPPGPGQDVTTFHTSAPSLDLEFGPPALVNDQTDLPRSRVASGCVAEGCSRTIRIDAAAFDDGAERWLFYVWFEGGNNIAGFRASAPETVILNAGPAVFPIKGFEEQINEAPDVFLRGGKYHLFFSTGFFDSQYAMFHIMADSVGELTRARAVRRHSTPLRAANDALVETHGHNSIVERRGEFFNIFHMGSFDGGGKLVDRSTHKQRIAFRPDGSIHALNYVDLRWSAVPGHQYSLDIERRDGTVVGPCIAAGILGSATSTRYTGICPSAGDLRVPKSEIAEFRLYYSNDGTWTKFVDQPHDGFGDRVFLKIAGGATGQVEIGWNERATGAEYSLDVRRKDDTWVAPCAGETVLGSEIRYTFTGSCPTANTSVSLQDIGEIRVCSAVGDDWPNAVCGTVPYDGVQGFVDVTIP